MIHRFVLDFNCWLNMSCDKSLFEDDQNFNSIKIFGIVLSILSIVFLTPSMYAIIWYERYGANQNRTLINHFVASACWAGIACNILIQIPEVIIAFGFTFGKLFCTCNLVLKNVLIIHYSSMAGSISIAKYFYIFVYKNPTGRFDEFWCLFVNSFVLGLSFLSQFVFQFLPGKNPYYYYVCSGHNPEEGLKAKVNLLLQINLAACFLIYVYVAIKIKHFDYQFKSVKIAPQVTSALKVGQSFKSTLSDFKTMAATLVTLLPVIVVAIILNATSGSKLLTFPYYFFVQFHLHGCPFLLLFFLTLSHYISNKKLREVIFRELKQLFVFSFGIIECNH